MRRNLNDVEIEEWTSLSHLLLSFNFKNQEDGWTWGLEKDKFFTPSSLTKKPASAGNLENSVRYNQLWEGCSLEILRFYIW